MEHHIDLRKTQMLGMLEILNDLGLSIVHIDNSFYVFTEFEPANLSEGIEYITLSGKNITSTVENALAKNGYNEQMRTELFQRISGEKDRRREFSPNTPWEKYSSHV